MKNTLKNRNTKNEQRQFYLFTIAKDVWINSLDTKPLVLSGWPPLGRGC